MIKRLTVLISSISVLVVACHPAQSVYDASGIFEAREIVISAEANGQLTMLSLKEGDDLAANEQVGEIDCKDFDLQKAQVEASIEALQLKKGEAGPEISVVRKRIDSQLAQIETLKTQLLVIEKERNRIKKMVDQDAAPSKQLDDAQGQVDILHKQIEAAKSQVKVLQQQVESQGKTVALKNRGLMSEQKPMQTSIERLENQLSNCKILNPIDGVVLTQYVEQFEYVNVGKPLYKVADLQEMTLRAYFSGDQLASIKLGEEVKVLVDKNNGGSTSYTGKIVWISGEAEFTPKTIQTKNERSNLVYAVKIAVKNDGFLRIGMYGEIQVL